MTAFGNQAPADLVRFMETFGSPPGETPLSLLSRYDSLLNAGGPDVQVRSAVPVCELDGWRVTVDVHVPGDPGPWPTVVFFHGGAWTMGSPASHSRMAREFAGAGFLTLSVDYPRAPKWRFPAAHQAALRAVEWTHAHGGDFGSDGTIALAGDSTGANLAAGVLAVHDRPPVSAAVLMYGIYDFHAALPLLAPLVGGATPQEQLYVPTESYEELRDDPRLSPLHAADRFPPCWLGVGTRDPLFSETAALAAALERAGVEHEYLPVTGAPHSYLQMPFLAEYAAGHRSMQAFLRCHSGSRNWRGNDTIL